MRQVDPARRDPELLARCFGVTYPPGHTVALHSHDWDQFVCTESGALRLVVADQLWLVPAGRGIWIPAGTPHEIDAPTRAALRSVYTHPGSVESMDRRLRAVEVSPLLRELTLYAVRLGALRRDCDHETRCFLLFGDLIGRQPLASLGLPMPGDPRGRRVARLILDRPGDPSDIGSLARRGAASRRTLERIFRAETGLTVGGWRRRARLLSAIELLAAGGDVTTTGYRVGYRSTSAFISRFREEFGVTPGRWVG